MYRADITIFFSSIRNLMAFYMDSFFKRWRGMLELISGYILGHIMFARVYKIILRINLLAPHGA